MANKTRIVILGGGFGGVYAALAFDRAMKHRTDLDVTLVSEDNFLLFTPLLHEVAAGDLYPGDIVNPLRKMLKRVHFVEAEITKVDLDAKTVHCERGLRRKQSELAYDTLVIAVGSAANFFDIEGLEDTAVTMKTISDAALLHNRMLAMMELASQETDPDERKKQLTFVAAGGGFAGVETIGAVNDFVRDAVEYYPELRPEELRVVVVHPHDVVLPELGEKLGRYAQKKLGDRGVEVILNAHVKSYDDSVIGLSNGKTIPTHNLIWTAGTKPGPVTAALDLEKEKGRIKVDATLKVLGRDDLWAVGDCASVPDHKTGKPQPGTAQHGLRQAVHAAKNILATLDGRPTEPFMFSTLGQLASIGRRTGVANVLGVNFSGFVAWWLWRSVYLMKLPRLAKKSRVAVSWTLDMLFSRDFEQLITARDIKAFVKLAERFKPEAEAMAAEPERPAKLEQVAAS